MRGRTWCSCRWRRGGGWLRWYRPHSDERWSGAGGLTTCGKRRAVERLAGPPAGLLLHFAVGRFGHLQVMFERRQGFCRPRLRIVIRAAGRLLPELVHVLVMVRHHLLHVGRVELGAA